MSVKRHTVTIKLHPIKDADLIKRIEQLEKGTYQSEGGRNAAIKAALRTGLDMPPPPQFDPIEDVRAALETAMSTINAQARRLAEQDHQIDELRTAITNVPKIIKSLSKGGGANGQDAAELADLRQQIAWLTEAVQWLHANGGTAAAPAPDEVEIGAARLSDEELKKRDARLSQTDW